MRCLLLAFLPALALLPACRNAPEPLPAFSLVEEDVSGFGLDLPFGDGQGGLVDWQGQPAYRAGGGTAARYALDSLVLRAGAFDRAVEALPAWRARVRATWPEVPAYVWSQVEAVALLAHSNLLKTPDHAAARPVLEACADTLARYGSPEAFWMQRALLRLSGTWPEERLTSAAEAVATAADAVLRHRTAYGEEDASERHAHRDPAQHSLGALRRAHHERLAVAARELRLWPAVQARVRRLEHLSASR